MQDIFASNYISLTLLILIIFHSNSCEIPRCLLLTFPSVWFHIIQRERPSKSLKFNVESATRSSSSSFQMQLHVVGSLHRKSTFLALWSFTFCLRIVCSHPVICLLHNACSAPPSAIHCSTFDYSLKFLRQKRMRDRLSIENHGHNRYCTCFCDEATLTWL